MALFYDRSTCLHLNTVMNNQDFVYFNWGTHDNQLMPYYGLVSPTADRIYVVGEDYQQLKFIQLLLLSSRQISTTTISAVPNYTHGIIDNSVCLNWMISSPWGQHSVLGLAGDFKSRRSDSLIEATSVASDSDFELQKNIMFLQTLVTEINLFFKREVADQIDNRHNESLRNFVEILMPEDQDIRRVIDFEIQLVEQYREKINNIKNNFIRTLSTVDYNQPYKLVHKYIAEKIDNIHDTNEIQKNFKLFLTNLITQ